MEKRWLKHHLLAPNDNIIDLECVKMNELKEVMSAKAANFRRQLLGQKAL